MLEGFKAVSTFITGLRSREFSADAARKAVDRSATRNPLPVKWEGGAAFFDEDQVRLWNAKEQGRRKRRSGVSAAA